MFGLHLGSMGRIGGVSLAADVAGMFGNGENGGVGVLSDFSTMYQDAARTTPVTAVGQPVGSLRLKYGPGIYYTAAGAARPLLQQDASGYYYLATDGATQFMSCPYSQSAYPLTLAVAAKADADTVGGAISVTASVVNYHGLIKAGSANAWILTDRNASIINELPPTVGTNATPHVLFAALASATLEARMDGTTNGATANTNAFGACDTLWLGCLRSATDFFNGRIYAPFVLSRAATSREMLTVEQFLAQQAGVVF